MSLRKRKSVNTAAPIAPSPDVSGSKPLQQEIAMLRTWMKMVQSMADEGNSLAELLKTLDILGKSSIRLATLLRAERDLCEEKDFGSVFNQALAEVIKEMGINDSGAR